MPTQTLNAAGAPPTHTILPGAGIPKPPSLGVVKLPEVKTTVPKPTDERTCYVQNSKTGDILNVLPILFHQFMMTGQKQVLMVSQEFADILSGCSYIEPIIWRGDWADLNGALEQARETFKNVVSLSTFGKTLNTTRQTPSFALEQWRLGNALEHYGLDDWPLIFDLRDRLREEILVGRHSKPGERLILFADHSHSSPFVQTDDLVQLLKEQFGDTHRILRLSEVRAEKIYDLLGLYERASVLVSIETMHLHLAAGSGVPVVALVADRPEIWHGTAWRKKFYLQCRYADYDQRKEEIVMAIRDAIALREVPEIEITGRGGYNLSTLDWPVGTGATTRIGVYRWHPKADSWRTELAAWTGTRTVKIAPPRGFEQHSIEDGRLFVHKDKLHLSYTVASQKGCVIQYGELDMSGEVWHIVNHYQPRYSGNDFTTLQKNWSFFSAEGKLYAAFQRSPEQIILEIDGDKVVSTPLKSKSPPWNWGQIRGGTPPIEHNGLWLQFFHSHTTSNKSAWGWCYYLGALLMEKTPPFQIVAVSRFPILAGTERYFPIARWKPRVLFPAGAIKLDNQFIVSVGVNDAATGRVILSEKDLNL